MKQYLTACMRIAAVIIAVALATVVLTTPQPAQAQSASEKVRLMADTLRARDSGNLNLAKEKAEELIKIAPDDENVQRLLASINRDLEARSGATAGAATPAASDAAVFGQAAGDTVEEAMESDPQVAGPDGIIDAAVSEQNARIEAAEAAATEAIQLAELGAFSEANSLLNSAESSLTLNTATAATLEKIDKAQAQLVMMEVEALREAGDLAAAEAMVEQYRAAGGSPRAADSLARSIDEDISNPYNVDINSVSPEYVAQSKIIRDLITRGRAQFLNGDYDGAQDTFKEVEARDANNSEAKLFQTRIATLLGEIHAQNHVKTRRQMLTEVDHQWERPKVFDIAGPPTTTVGPPAMQEKLNKIVIPQVNFSGMELTRVIETLAELSAVYDEDQEGLNIVPLFNPNENNPRVNISLRNLNLDRILQFVTQQVNFAYDVGADAVTIAPSDGPGGTSNTITEFFPITRATVIRLTGIRGGGGSSGPVDPFAAPSAPAASGGATEETEALQNFFQGAGVNFDLPGTSLVYDGEQLIVTQTRRNLERMRIILRNYNEIKQVEIEAKFLEVAQNDLDELGFDWGVNEGGQRILDDQGFPLEDQFGNEVFGYQRTFTTNGRTINDAFTTDASTAAINISGIDPIPVAPPSLNQAIDLAAGTGNFASIAGWTAGNYDINLQIRALSRKAGSDLMSAPKVTVLSGKKATITVAQELRYPESYGDIESTVGNSNNNSTTGGGGGSSISITAGTPQDFVTRNVGVELSVTPNVENDDTISLLLEPRVTEFEGFVEYGGPSVAVSGGNPGAALAGIAGSNATVVTVPAGFYQPIFSTRELATEVTIFDGATLVMGGLTRDEVKTVNDSVPILGDVPGLGRLFRSEGETRQKRNLLIFVTANLVSPGGSPARQSYRGVDANALFQNPTIMTPSGSVNRGISEE